MIREVVFVLLEVSLIATFLAIFYFTYVKNVENNIVDQQISYLVTDLTDISKYVLDDEERQKIRDKLNEIQIPDLKEEDKRVINNNNKIENQATIYISVLLSVGFLAFIAYYIHSTKIGKGDIVFGDFMNALVILLAVAITEYLFLNLIVKNYRSVKVNNIKYKILENINNFSNKND